MNEVRDFTPYVGARRLFRALARADQHRFADELIRLASHNRPSPEPAPWCPPPQPNGFSSTGKGSVDDDQPHVNHDPTKAQHHTTRIRTQHQKLRRREGHNVNAGIAICARCHEPIARDAAWELDHTDDRTGYLGPAHQLCNRQAGGRKGAAVTNAQRSMTVRDW